jgi:L-aspartate oxidase
MHTCFDERRYLIPFRATLLPQIFTDVLVIGAGVAGMRAAIAAADAGSEVIVTGKGKIDQSNTFWAQGGIAAVLHTSEAGGEDTFDAHVRDTMIAGAGLCDEPAVRQVIEGGPPRIRELIDWGMPFDLAHKSRGDGDDAEPRNGQSLAYGREGGHSQARIVHSDGDATGKALARCLFAQMKKSEHVRYFEQCFVLDLITVEGQPPRVLGAITHHPKYGLQVIWASATILASGGAGQAYRESTNPRVATGDGLAMAYRAGAVLGDLAFMQFHPTTLYIAGASRSLITEAVRGEGGHLIDRSGHRFMPDYDERAELAPRDIVSRSILAQMAKTTTTHVYLDVRHLPHFAQRFPGIQASLRQFDIDPMKQPIPVHPSAHYMIGGVVVDDRGRTNLAGLYAAGEVASTGLHGANRLASNSLLEGLVCGAIAGQTAREMVEANGGRSPAKVVSDIRLSERSELDLSDVRSSLRSVMWRHVGIERDGQRLAEVGEMFDFWARYTLDKIFDEQSGWEAQNLLLVGALMTRAARWRNESRGTHFRLDQPQPREELRVHDLWQRGCSEPTTRPAAGAAVEPVRG